MTAIRSHSSVRAGTFSNIEFLHSLRPTYMKLGLENIAALLEGLGNPQSKVPAVLVAGTNGKGSVTTYVSSILRRAGMKTGTFYSPHLFRLNERIRVDGEEIPSPVLDRILGRLREFRRDAPFTFFEGITAAAMLYFAGEKVDTAVYEVGLGGRLDATNLVNAAVTVITGISLDHREHLGRTKLRILREKLGIVRSGTPLVANLREKRLAARAEGFCREKGVPFHNVAREVRKELVSMTFGNMVFTLGSPVRSYGELSSRMIGKVQMENAATAVRTVELLGERARGAGVGEVAEGIARGFLAGRFQVLPGEPRIILDVSHNEEALLAAAANLLEVSPKGRNVILFGVMARKELGRFPARAAKAAREIILVPLRDGQSAGAEDLLGRFGGGAGTPGGGNAVLRVARGMGDAVRIARGTLGPGDTLLVTGSHLTVEEAAAYM